MKVRGRGTKRALGRTGANRKGWLGRSERSLLRCSRERRQGLSVPDHAATEAHYSSCSKELFKAGIAFMSAAAKRLPKSARRPVICLPKSALNTRPSKDNCYRKLPANLSGEVAGAIMPWNIG